MREGQIIGYFSIAAAIFAVFLMVSMKGSSPLAVFFPGVFGAPDQGPQPQDTLIAPFARVPAGYVAPSAKDAAMRLPVNDIPLNQPHRTADEVAAWAMKAVAESLHFDAGGLEKTLSAPGPYFTPAGHTQFKEFIEASRFREYLASGEYFLHSYVEEAPFLLNKGESGGNYRWLLEVPVMASFLPAGVKTYKGTNPANQEFVVTIQVGRYRDAGEDGVRIETWKGVPRRK